MIETLEGPLTVAETHKGVVVAVRKQLTANEIHERCRIGMSVTAPNLCLVPVDTIYDPIAVIPDEGGFLGDFLFICPVENWGGGFMQVIEDNEASKLAEQEGLSDTLSNSDMLDNTGFEQNSSERSVIINRFPVCCPQSSYPRRDGSAFARLIVVVSDLLHSLLKLL
jgi:hypothetical protein